jgi:hypothetical protein
MKRLFLLVTITLFLLSCGVQKRKYQKGYYASWCKSKSPKKTPISFFKTKENSAIEPVDQPLGVLAQEDSPTIASNNHKNSPPILKKQKPLLLNDEPCDELLFRDGSEIKGKVIEITPKEIKYKKCDMLDGPLYVLKKSKLFMITYANGTRDVFKEETIDNNQNRTQNTKKNHNLAILAFTFGLIGIYPSVISILGIAGIIFGIMALRKIRQEPDTYKGEAISKIGIVFGIIGLIFGILIIGLLILA